MALYAGLEKQQPQDSPLLREYEAAFARVTSALGAATATAAPPPPSGQVHEPEPEPEVVVVEEEEGEREDRGLLVDLLDRYSERLVALVERRLEGAGAAGGAAAER